MLCSPMIAPALSGSVPLDAELDKCFSGFLSPLQWDRMAGMGCGWCSLSSRSIRLSHPAGQALINQFLLRADLVKKNRVLGMFQNASFSPPAAGSGREFFSDSYYKNLFELLKINLTKFCPPRLRLGPAGV